MGWGDDIMAVGAAIARGWKRGGCIIGRSTDKPNRSPMYRGLDWVNPPGARHFLRSYNGYREYFDYKRSNAKRQVLHENHRPHPGELSLPEPSGDVRGVILHTQVKTSFSGDNKRWPWAYWVELRRELEANGVEVWQVDPPGSQGLGCSWYSDADVRKSLAQLQAASAVVTSEGLLHHAAAALEVPAVVLWGGRTDPRILGYPGQANLTSREEWCGSRRPCDHCAAAMRDITPDQVMAEVLEVMGQP